MTTRTAIYARFSTDKQNTDRLQQGGAIDRSTLLIVLVCALTITGLRYDGATWSQVLVVFLILAVGSLIERGVKRAITGWERRRGS